MQMLQKRSKKKMGRGYEEKPKTKVGLCLHFHSTECGLFAWPASIMAGAGGRVLTRHVEIEELWMKAPEKGKHYFRITFAKNFTKQVGRYKYLRITDSFLCNSQHTFTK